MVVGPRGSPLDEVGEIDIRGEVHAADVLVDFEALDALVEEVAAKGAVGAAVVDLGARASVVDGEHSAAFPEWHPTLKFTLERLVDLNPLVDRVVLLEAGGIRE